MISLFLIKNDLMFFTMCIFYEICFKSHGGVLHITCCEKGVHSINVKNFLNYKQEKSFGEKELNNSEANENPTAKNVIVWFKNYFEAPNKVHENIPTVCPTVLSLKGKFTEKVWSTLFTNVPFGTTVSYSELAGLCGNSSASRAVGTAMKNNPVPILIPCHRVIKSDGSVGHYSGGNGMKEWLLKHENVIL